MRKPILRRHRHDFQRRIHRHLHGVHHIQVKEPVQEPHLQRRRRIIRDQTNRPRMGQLQVFDDQARLDDAPLAIRQHRKLPHRRAALQFRLMLWLVRPELPELEWQGVLIDRNQRLLREGREGVTIKGKCHSGFSADTPPKLTPSGRSAKSFAMAKAAQLLQTWVTAECAPGGPSATHTGIKVNRTMTIHPVIMCGGAGTRLWPVSNQACPKQFHSLVSDKSVFQETVLRFAGADGFHAEPVIVSNAAYAGLIADQLAAIGVTPAAILLEPEGRNTAAVAAVAARYLAAAFPDGLGLLVPSDHFIGRPDVFLGAIRAAAPVAAGGYITTFGIAPSRPDTGFGYIQSGAPLSGPVARVAAFKEKPDAATAAAYLATGAYSWNAGIFLFSPAAMLAELAAHAPAILATSAAALAAARIDGACVHLDPVAFAAVPSTSIDYAVMEHTALAAVLAPVDCAWSDIGTWSMVGEVSSRENTPAPVLINSENCLVHAADGQLVALVGVEGLVVVADGNRILVTARDRTQDVGAVVKALKDRGLKDFL